MLCYLEGATQEVAAVQLKLAKSTLRERLERARSLLRTRLLRRGLGPAALLVAAAWPAANASACVPISVVSSTLKAASLVAAEQGVATGLISAKVGALTNAVLNGMLVTKLKIATALLMVPLFLGVGTLSYVTQMTEQTPKGKKAENPGQSRSNEDEQQGTWVQVSVEEAGQKISKEARPGTIDYGASTVRNPVAQ